MDDFKGKSLPYLRQCLAMLQENNSPGIASGMRFVKDSPDRDLHRLLDWLTVMTNSPSTAIGKDGITEETLHNLTIAGRLALIGFYTCTSLLCNEALAQAEAREGGKPR